MRIAVIEESDEHLRLVCEQIVALGHDLSFVASTAPDAIRALSGHDIDVIISDQVLPGADGEELMREIRNAHRNIRVVAISGSYLERSMLPTSKLLGASTVLPRPYQLSELDHAIVGTR
ncbi:MAG: response regulator [Pseudomonadota bacterium]